MSIGGSPNIPKPSKKRAKPVANKTKRVPPAQTGGAGPRTGGKGNRGIRG